MASLIDFLPGSSPQVLDSPHSYLVANRNTTEIDETLRDARWSGVIETDAKALSKVRLGKGLIWRSLDDESPIYQRHSIQLEINRKLLTTDPRKF